MLKDERLDSADNGHDGHARAHGSAHEDLLVAWRRIRSRVPEFERHLQAYVAVQLDKARLSLRRMALRVVVGALAIVVALVATVAAATMLAAGIGEGLTALFGGRAWLGHLVGGATLLGALAAMIAIGYARRRRRDWDRLLRRHGPEPAQRAAVSEHEAPEHVALEPQGPEL